jgi:hypothetical protein
MKRKFMPWRMRGGSGRGGTVQRLVSGREASKLVVYRSPAGFERAARAVTAGSAQQVLSADECGTSPIPMEGLNVAGPVNTPSKHKAKKIVLQSNRRKRWAGVVSPGQLPTRSQSFPAASAEDHDESGRAPISRGIA